MRRIFGLDRFDGVKAVQAVKDRWAACISMHKVKKPVSVPVPNADGVPEQVL
jgi:hypothetical protein